MKLLTYFIVLSLWFVSCKEQENQETKLLASFGEQPTVATKPNGDIVVVFAEKESIYCTISTNQGKSFSKPSLVAKLEGLVVGFSSGPGLAITSDAIVVSAPDRMGNLYTWTKVTNSEKWSDPVRVNDIEKSVGESLSDITATPDGNLFSIWIDTRELPGDHKKEHEVTKNKTHDKKTKQNTEEDLSEMTPIGITKGELYKQIGDIPENAHLAFYGDSQGKLYWVFLDENHQVLKAENIVTYQKFLERNSGRTRSKGKIYLSTSNDAGLTWSVSKMIYRSPDGSVCECCKPSIISDENGHITVMFRNNINGSRDLYFTKSTDGGKTFTTAEKLGTGTWKINGCPMDGGDLMIDKKGVLKTVWQRKGELFASNSNDSEQKIGKGKSPSIASNKERNYIVFSKGNDIITMDFDNSSEIKIGTGKSPKVLALEKGALYFWANSDGINYKKVL